MLADLHAALRTRLLADAELFAMVGDRIHWMRVPPGAELPFIKLLTVSGTEDYALGGPTGACHARVQCDCYAATNRAARAIAKLAQVALARPAIEGGVTFARTIAGAARDLGDGATDRASFDWELDFRCSEVAP